MFAVIVAAISVWATPGMVAGTGIVAIDAVVVFIMAIMGTTDATAVVLAAALALQTKRIAKRTAKRVAERGVVAMDVCAFVDII